MRISKEAPIIVEARGVLIREPPDRKGLSQHPQHRPIGECCEKKECRS
jgi:hypothetical protein